MPKTKTSSKKSGRLSSTVNKITSRYTVFVKNFLGILFVILGFIFLYKLPAIPSNNKPAAGSEPIHASSKFSENKKNPQVVRILLPKENIDLPVTPSKIVGGYWQTSLTTASQGDGTANPGTGGNVVVFAHAREGLFYNLKDVVKGDIVYVFTKNGWFRYRVGEIQKVYPTDVAVVAPTKKEVLTLFTCSGFFDEKRLIVKAYPVSSL